MSSRIGSRDTRVGSSARRERARGPAAAPRLEYRWSDLAVTLCLLLPNVAPQGVLGFAAPAVGTLVLASAYGRCRKSSGIVVARRRATRNFALLSAADPRERRRRLIAPLTVTAAGRYRLRLGSA
jgi:hypothetical protein